ncbi:MAG TPA: NADH-ubiquinone oxidoreductase-F iron-sulfur binding region domain-containing protein [Bacteroidales bacterium]|nr:NADH-ubiquinone oxidoreductase-F iron-sulfur binding region domain-containing protein [Bacteroidales bacterium]
MDVRDFLISEVLTSKSPVTAHSINGRLAEIRRDRISRPVIYIGTGSCGLVAGAGNTLKTVKEYLGEKSIDAEIVEVGCIGLCSAEPLMDVQIPGKSRISFNNVDSTMVEPILDDIFNGIVPADNVLGQFLNPLHEAWNGVEDISRLPFFRYQHRIVLANCGKSDPQSISGYIARGGYSTYLKCLNNYTAEKVCDIIDESGLRGRGGGGYTTGRKWKTAHNSVSDQKYLVCNAAESDPGAFMDRAIIEGDPHLLLEGIAIAAYAIGATKAYIYIMADYQQAIKNLKLAIAQMKEYALSGYNIFRSGTDLQINVVVSPGAFVCGEETALINSIQGKRAMPAPKPPYPAIEGLFRKPTVINNVETLANVPFILRHGPQAFNSIGTANSKGTKVFAVTGKSARTGLIEVEMGTTLKDLIFKIAGGIKNEKHFKAVQIGGPSGSCVPEQQLDLPVDYESLWEAGAIMGSGGMVVMDENTCMVDMVKFFMNFLQQESCGKCIPCREGTRRIHEILENITRRPPSESGHEVLERFKGIMQLEGLAEVIRDTSLCGLGQTAPNPLISAMKWFRDEFEEHVFDRKCRAGVCKELRVFYIEVDKCTGCVACLRKCPTNAIVGQPRQPHFIIEDKCIGCGICYDVCKFVAITIK